VCVVCVLFCSSPPLSRHSPSHTHTHTHLLRHSISQTHTHLLRHSPSHTHPSHVTLLHPAPSHVTLLHTHTHTPLTSLSFTHTHTHLSHVTLLQWTRALKWDGSGLSRQPDREQKMHWLNVLLALLYTYYNEIH